MNRIMKIFLTLALVLAAASVQAEEKIKIQEVIVTTVKMEEAVEETTSAVTVIRAEEIKEMNAEFLTDVLRKVPELSLIQNGGPGKQAAVFMRGGSSSHTLVLIDGTRVNDPNLGLFDLSTLGVDDIERIEIVRGPQSTIYGSDAISGVINIITKKGEGKPKADFSFETGSFKTYKPSVTFSGGNKQTDYRGTVSYFKTDGISAAKTGTERDGYEKAAFSGKFGIRPAENFEIEIAGRYSYDRSDLDAFDKDALNYVQLGNHGMLSAKGKLYLFNKWEQVLTVSTVHDSARFRDPDTAWNNADVRTTMQTIDWQHNFFLSDRYTLTAGAEYRREQGRNEGSFDNSIENKAFYLNTKSVFFEKNLIVNAGLRHDDHQIFGSETTYRIGAVYDINRLGAKVRASYGTGFRAPTLNELFYNDPWGSIGNLNLKPEKSSSWEIGADKALSKDISISITYFDQDFRDLIQWVETSPGSWIYTPENVAKAKASGIETSASIKITDNLTLKAGYTWLDAKDDATGLRLPRRAKDKFNTTLACTLKDVSVAADINFIGQRYDDVPNNMKLSPYSLVNLSGTYRLSKNVSIFSRIENLLNAHYEEAAGYGSRGFSMYGGVRITTI